MEWIWRCDDVNGDVMMVVEWNVNGVDGWRSGWMEWMGVWMDV